MREKRSELGYRCGDFHHNAKASDAVVARARDMHEFEGLTPTVIAQRLGVPLKTIQHWIYYTSRNVPPREREERVPTHRTLR